MKQYVWLNLNTGEFSNSWNESDHKKYNVERLLDDSDNKSGWKLIEYTCLNDDNFYFYNKMKLK